MILDPARYRNRQLSGCVRWAAMVIAVTLPLSARTEDSSAAVCTANGGNADCVSAPAPSSPAGDDPLSLDWAELREVPEALRDERCLHCGGRYLDPLADADRSGSPGESRVEANADSTELRGDTITLEGNVEVRQGYRLLRGDRAVIDRQERSGVLTGDISLREPGLLLRGESAEILSRTGEATVEQSTFVLHERHLHGTSSLLERDADEVIHVHEGYLSFCAPDENDWSLHAREIALDLDEGLGTAYGSHIEVAGVPVFYSPWLQFPLDDRRRTGFLWPDIGTDSRGGADIAVPVYFNIRPNWDAIYAPRYIEERGFNHEVKVRHLNRYVGAWEVGGAYMDEDDRYRDDYPDDRSYDRWLFNTKHDALFRGRWRSRVDYTKVSDPDYIKDLETNSIDSKRNTALLQLASMDYLGDRWLVEAELQQFQSLAEDIRDDYKKLPQLTARYRPTGQPFRIDPVLEAQYSNFDADDQRVTGQRLYAEAGATYPMRWMFGFLQPTAKYRQLSYDLDDHRAFPDNSPSSGVGLFSLDGGLFFDRQTSIAGESLLQTLEPRLYYLYSGYDNQRDQPDFDSAELTFSYNQLFRETRFSGHDRLDDSNQLSMGMTTRYINNDSGREQFSATVGQILYFEDYKVRLNALDPPLDNSRSELAGEFNFSPNDQARFRGNMIWDPNNNKMNSGNLQASYTWDEEKVVNLGYTYRRPIETLIEQPSTEEVHFSTYMPISRRWAVFGAINYSLKGDTSVEDMIGVEYDSCCWKVRLLHLRYYDTAPGETPDFGNPDLQREHSTQIQIVLKGMGGFGNRISNLMEDMIRGFRDVEY